MHTKITMSLVAFEMPVTLVGGGWRVASDRLVHVDGIFGINRLCNGLQTERRCNRKSASTELHHARSCLKIRSYLNKLILARCGRFSGLKACLYSLLVKAKDLADDLWRQRLLRH